MVAASVGVIVFHGVNDVFFCFDKFWSCWWKDFDP